MFHWKAVLVKKEERKVRGAGIAVDNIWMVRFLLTGNPDRVHVVPKRFTDGALTIRNGLCS